MVTKCCCCCVSKKEGKVIGHGGADDREQLIRTKSSVRPASGDSSFSNSTFASATSGPLNHALYEDECDARLDNDRSSGIVTLADEDDEDLIDLTSPSQQQQQSQQASNHRLQPSPKVTFFDPSAIPPGSSRNLFARRQTDLKGGSVVDRESDDPLVRC